MEGFSLMHPKVSVIVPIYHSEKYLERCCRSLFEQTLDEIEFLLILDGTSDEADLIIERLGKEYPHRKEWITIIRHSQNQGVSCCRQEGIERSRGDYLFFCDSDDWMESVALASLYNLAVSDNNDLVYADYVRHYEQTGKEVYYSSSHVTQGVISSMDGTLFNKLIRRELISENHLSFPTAINWGEDLCMSVMLQILARKICYLPQCFYHYCMHPSSLTTSLALEKYQQLVSCPLYVEEELKKRGLADQYAMLLMQMKFEVKEYYLIQKPLRDIQTWKRTYPECHTFIWKYRGVPSYLKVAASLACSSLTIPFSWIILQCRDIYVWLRDNIC